MKIALGTDHRGLCLTRKMRDMLQREGHEVTAFMPDSDVSVDYPDYAVRVGAAVRGGACDCGILICGTGVGMAIAANKIRGIRAALCWDIFTARRSRTHNDANVLCIGNDVTAETLAFEIVREWLATEHEGGRHQRRVEKIMRLEEDTESQA